MTDRDRDALKLALKLARTLLDPAIAGAVDAMLKTSTWEEAGAYASFHLQTKSLRLRPWQTAPCDADQDFDPTPGARELAARMERAGLSKWCPDPMAALAEAERVEAEPRPAA